MPQAKIRRYLKHGTMHQLSVFEAVARLGSYTRAAEELHIAQPTASVQIKKLTETIGLPLFEQVGNRAYLTEAGRELRTACQEIFQELVKIEDRLSSIRGLESGRLWLAVSTAGKYFAPRMLAAFVQRHPGIDVSLRIHNREMLLERLADDADDLYIFAEPPGDVDVVVQQILPNPMVVFARSDHALAGQARIPFARLAQEPFLMRERGSGTRAATQEIFARHGLQPRVRMELSTNEAIKEAILAGLGVSIMSRYTLGPELGEDALVTLDVEGFPLERHWYFVYPIGKQLSVAAQAFMEFTREHVQRQFVLDRTAPSLVAHTAISQ
jgi:LysR family transcriptional regulator, low CO2-responsive transcriptional regulator